MPYAPKTHRPPRLKSRAHKQRPSPAKRGYNAYWRRLRKWFLQQHPWCADPFGFHAKDNRRYVVAEHVDHIVPLAGGGTNDEDNLQGLCVTCHRRKTVLHDGGFGRTKRVMRAQKKESPCPK